MAELEIKKSSSEKYLMFFAAVLLTFLALWCALNTIAIWTKADDTDGFERRMTFQEWQSRSINEKLALISDDQAKIRDVLRDLNLRVPPLKDRMAGEKDPRSFHDAPVDGGSSPDKAGRLPE